MITPVAATISAVAQYTTVFVEPVFGILSFCPGVGVGEAGFSLGIASGVEVGFGVGVDSVVGVALGVGVGVGSSLGSGVGVGVGSVLGLGTGVGVGVGSTLGVGVGVGVGSGVAVLFGTAMIVVSLGFTVKVMSRKKWFVLITESFECFQFTAEVDFAILVFSYI